MKTEFCVCLKARHIGVFIMKEMSSEICRDDRTE